MFYQWLCLNVYLDIWATWVIKVHRVELHISSHLCWFYAVVRTTVDWRHLNEGKVSESGPSRVQRLAVLTGMLALTHSVNHAIKENGGCFGLCKDCKVGHTLAHVNGCHVEAEVHLADSIRMLLNTNCGLHDSKCRGVRSIPPDAGDCLSTAR